MRSLSWRVLPLAVALLASHALAVDEPEAPLPASAPDAGVAEPEVDLLAEAPEPGAASELAKTFGEALSLLKLEATWSGYGDVVLAFVPDKPPTFLMTHFNPILSARMGEHVSAEIELEFEPGKFLAEYALVDFTPHRAFTVRLGRFLIPIGQFNEVLHPSFRWNMVSRPLMHRTVSPAVMSSVGAQVRGAVPVGAGATFDYAVYVVNGMGGGAEFTSNAEVARNLRREDLEDNNADKAFGARAGVRLFADRQVGSTQLGVSFYSGAIDPRAAYRLTIADVDASLKLGPLLLRGEFAQSFLGPEGTLIPFESGVYVQASAMIWKLDVAARFDWARERPFALTPLNKRALVASVAYRAFTYWSARAEVSVPVVDGSSDFRPTVNVMAAFSF